MAKIYDRCGAFLRDAGKVFWFSFGLGAVISAISILTIADIYRDVASVYAYHARELGSSGFAAGWVGRVPMLNIILAGGLVRLGADAYRACVAVSCAFYVLTLFPLRRLLERYLSPLASAYGCLLFIVTPKVIRYSVSGTIDPARYFFLIAALLFMFRLAERPNWRDAVAFGACAAGMAVSRGEGVVVAAIMLAAAPLLFLFNRNSAERAPASRHLAAAATAWAVFLVGITPFCVGNLVKHNAFVTDVRFADQIPALKRNLRNNATGSLHVIVEKDAAVSRLVLFRECVNNSLRGGFELYWAFSGIGILALLYRRKWRWEFSALLAVYLLHQAIYFKNGIAAYRYSIYIVPMFMPFTVSGMGFCLEAYRRLRLPDRWRVFLNVAGVAGAAVAAVFFIDNGMQIVFNRVDEYKREAAAFIREWCGRNIPGRRPRIAGDGDFPEVAYWSGAVVVNGYNSPRRWDECLDCDLIVVGDRDLPAAKARSELVFLKSFAREGGDHRCHLFQVVRANGDGEGEK